MKSFKISHENEKEFHIDHGDGKPYRVAKKGISKNLQDKIRKMAHGGAVLKLAEGTPDKPIAEVEPSTGAPIAEDPGTSGTVARIGEKIFGGELPSPEPTGATGGWGEGPEAPPESISTPTGTITPEAVKAALAGTTTPGSKVGTGGGYNWAALTGAAEQEQKGANINAANIAEAKAEEFSRNQKDWNDKIAELDAQANLRTQKQLADEAAKRKEIEAGRIDPSHWLSSRTVGQKIVASLSIALGGIGAGLTGGPNVALGIIQKHIDQDIDAQKANLGKKQTDYSNLLQQGYSAAQAESLLRSRMMADAGAKGLEIATRYGGPEAQAKAQQLNAGLSQQHVDNVMKIAQTQAVLRHEAMGERQANLAFEYQKAQYQALGQYLRTGQMPPGGEMLLPEEMLKRIRAMAPDAKTLEAMEGVKTASDRSTLSKIANVIPGVSYLPDILPSTRAAFASDTQILQGLMAMEGITRPTHPAVKGWEKMIADTHSINPEIAKDARKRLAGIMTAHAEARRKGATGSAVSAGSQGAEE